MKKRLISLLCTVALILGCLVFPATAQECETYYQAGYAKMDITPLDGETIIPVPMAGYGNPESRWATEITDHLYATCTAVTDTQGNTMFYVTVDAINVGSIFVGEIRKAIMDAFAEREITVKNTQIMVSASHTHSGPDFYNIYENRENTEEARYAAAWTYYQTVVEKISAAAANAYDSREDVTMSKGEADASDVTGYTMNAVRHYETTSTSLYGYGTDTETYIAGDNFGGSGHYKGYIYTSAPLNNYKVESVKSVTQANDKLYLLMFKPVSGDNDPIVLANWRAHPAINGSSAKTNISADYVGYFRDCMERAGYRAAFIQGASGNINARSYDDDVYMVDGVDWRTEANSADLYCYVYGSLLTQVAVKAAESAQDCELGTIRVETMRYQTQAQKDDEGLQAAATAALANTNATYPYRHTYEGATYIVNSLYHAKNILSRAEYYSSGVTARREYNVIAMGEDVMILTAPHELYDYYDAAGSTKPEDNDWLELVDKNTYGTPFVMGYTNDSGSYLPNTLAYEYNEDSDIFGAGSYEANISSYAKGEGEKLIDSYRQVLSAMAAEEETCPMCGQKVRWTPLFAETISGQTWQTGHYRLTEDVPVARSAQKILQDGATVCFDMNGYNITTAGRNFNIPAGSTLNLMGQGTVLSYTGDNNVAGGTCTVNGILNIYDGVKLQFEKNHTYRTNEKIEVEDGGVLYVGGTVNMYGGQIIGGELADASYNTDPICNGGAVFVTNAGTLKIYGGSITAGSGATVGDCVYLANYGSRVLLSRDAEVEEIYLYGYSGDSLTVKDTFTGTATLKFRNAVDGGTDIGASDNAQITGTLTYTDGTGNGWVTVSENDLVLMTYAPGSVACVGAVGYPTLKDALDVASAEPVKLLTDVTENVTVSHNDTLELNGKSINGTVTVNSGMTLYVSDSATADFTVTDGVYGKIKTIAGEGTVAGGETACGRYVEVTEKDIGTSFHLVEAALTGLSLRASSAGMYYTGMFRADEKVAVTSYGVALSTAAIPTSENLESCKYSQMTDWTAGAANDGNGTLLYNIMNEKLGYTENKTRSEMPVYGRGYVQVGDEWIFGNSAQYSLRELTEAVDTQYASLSSTQKKNLEDLYNRFTQVTDFWQLPKLKAALQAAYEKRPLKILTIGHSLAVDSGHMLAKVAQMEGTTDIEIGTLYYSGCTLAQHVKYLSENTAAYNFYHSTLQTADAAPTITSGVTMQYGITYTDWDIIVMQAGVFDAGIVSTYNSNIDTIIDYVNANKTNPDAQFAWHMTWAAPEDADLLATSDSRSPTFKSSFEKYFGSSQLTMHSNIASAVRRKISTREEFAYIIPSATAIQNANVMLDDTDLYRDYIHVSDLGRVVAAYTWYVTLTGKDIQELKMDTIPAALRYFAEDQKENRVLTQDEQAIILESVKNAVTNPYKVTQSAYTAAS